MKKRNSKETICKLLIIGSLLVAALRASEAKAQGICIPDQLKVNAVCGQIVFKGEKSEDSVSEGTVELREGKDNGRTVAKTAVDSSGCFSINNLKPGRYILIAKSRGLHQLVVPVHLVKASSMRETPCHIVIALGADAIEPCGGGYAKIRNDAKPCGKAK